MSQRTAEVLRRTNVSVQQIQEGNEKSLVFNLQKLAVKSAEYVKTLWLFGVDQNGYSVSVAVQDFSPSFLIKSPDTWDANDADAVDDLSALVDSIHEATRQEGSPEKITSVDFVLMTPFIGFTNGRKDRMVRFTCRNLNDCALVVKYLDSMKFTMYHEDPRSFPAANQWLQQTGIQYQTWIEISPIRYSSSRMTHTSLEGYCSMEDIHKYKGEIKLSNIPLLKACIRMKAISRDGAVEKKYQYRYNPNLPCDRIVAIGIYYSWNQDHTTVPCKSSTFTIIPDDSQDSKPYATEREMLDAFRDELVEMDPDEIFFFPDEFQTWEYYATRVHSQCTNGSALRLERFKTSKIRTMRQNNTVSMVKFETRNVFNIELALQKKVFVSVESYDLYTCSAHKDFRKEPCRLYDLIRDNRLANKYMSKGIEGRRKILQALQQDLNLISALELDTSMSGEYSNVSKASDTDLTDVVSRGEQIRVFNTLMHFNLDNNMYVNREKLGQKPLRFRISERPPTFKEPEELAMNIKLREECLKALEDKLSYHLPKKVGIDFSCRDAAMKWFDERKDDGENPEEADQAQDEETKKHAKDAEELEGGSVLKPSCGFWDDQRTCIFDFASLYPSIMMAFNFSYENLVYDEEYLDLPGVEYLTIPVNKYETVVTANVPGIIPKMLRTFVDNRSSIKKRMKSEPDPFRKKTLDFEQNSMKVLCNGTYGFTGAEKRGALLAIKEIMYMVTGTGRYLQKLCSTHVGITYNIRTIYGDTDSIFVLINLPEGHQNMTIEQITEAMGRMYKMEHFFQHELKEDWPFTWEHVVKFYMMRKKVDISAFIMAHKINALFYLVSSKLTDELSDLVGRPPVKLEFENMADKVWMSNAKKTYCYRFWSEGDPSKISKIKITGMPVKKREWSPWTRSVLMGVTERILYDRTSEIQAYLEKELDRLVQGKVPVKDLMVSKGFKNKSAYKHFRQAHLQVMLKIEQRTRWPVKDKSRLYFVVLRGSDQLYLRSETPEFAEEQKLELDLSYYLHHQFYNPMKKLLTYHPELFNFEDLFKKYTRRLEMKDMYQSDLTAENVGKRKLLTEEDLIERFKNKKTTGSGSSTSTTKRKGAMVDDAGAVDPFAKFLKKKT